jgi:hypothetical protein
MIVLLHPAAAAEMEQAYDFLEAQRPGLGEQFSVELETVLLH